MERVGGRYGSPIPGRDMEQRVGLVNEPWKRRKYISWVEALTVGARGSWHGARPGPFPVVLTRRDRNFRADPCLHTLSTECRRSQPLRRRLALRAPVAAGREIRETLRLLEQYGSLDRGDHNLSIAGGPPRAPTMG